MSLKKPHPMYTHASTAYQANKCVTVARLLSGRFRSGSLLRHFYPDKISGICELCNIEIEDIPHIILPKCPRLHDKSLKMLKYAKDSFAMCPTTAKLFSDIFTGGKDDFLKVQFMIDPSVIPEVITAAQADRDLLCKLFRVTTTWCYTLVRTRRQLLDAKF